jgi:hypothetical protein
MKEFVKDIQNLIVKHWGKLIVVFLIVGTIINFNDVKRGFMNGWNNGYNTTQTK